MLSIADMMLSVLWISGSVVWLKQEKHDENPHKYLVGCFSITLMTVVSNNVKPSFVLNTYVAKCTVTQRCFSCQVCITKQISTSVLKYSECFALTFNCIHIAIVFTWTHIQSITSQILQCVTMNLTLLYALLAYSSIKQRDFSGVYVS